MEQAILEALASGGSVAILAGIIFMMYRRDKEVTEKRVLESRKASEKLIMDICNDHRDQMIEDRKQLTEIIEADRETRKEHTRAVTELTITIQRMNGRHKYGKSSKSKKE